MNDVRQTKAATNDYLVMDLSGDYFATTLLTVYHNLLKPKVTSSDEMFCASNSSKPKDLQFSIK